MTFTKPTVYDVVSGKGAIEWKKKHGNAYYFERVEHYRNQEMGVGAKIDAIIREIQERGKRGGHFLVLQENDERIDEYKVQEPEEIREKIEYALSDSAPTQSDVVSGTKGLIGREKKIYGNPYYLELVKHFKGIDESEMGADAKINAIFGTVIIQSGRFLVLHEEDEFFQEQEYQDIYLKIKDSLRLRATNRQLPDTEEPPTDNDVIMGRGKNALKKNPAFQSLVKRYQVDYDNAPSGHKHEVVQRAIKEFQDEGRRFLDKESDGRWSTPVNLRDRVERFFRPPKRNKHQEREYKWAEAHPFTDSGNSREMDSLVALAPGRTVQKRIVTFHRCRDDTRRAYVLLPEVYKNTTLEFESVGAREVRMAQHGVYELVSDTLTIKTYNLGYLYSMYYDIPEPEDPFRELFFMRWLHENRPGLPLVNTARNGFVGKFVGQDNQWEDKLYIITPFMRNLADARLPTRESVSSVLEHMNLALKGLHELGYYHGSITLSSWFIADEQTKKIVLGNFEHVQQLTEPHAFEHTFQDPVPFIELYGDEMARYQTPKRYFGQPYLRHQNDQWSKCICFWEFHTSVRLWDKPSDDDPMFVIVMQILSGHGEIIRNLYRNEAPELQKKMDDMVEMMASIRQNDNDLFQTFVRDLCSNPNVRVDPQDLQNRSTLQYFMDANETLDTLSHIL